MKYLKKNIFVFFFFCILLSGCDKEIQLSDPVKMSFIACGDADITLIRNEEYTVLIDTGEDVCSETVMNYLEENVQSIDLMVLTHPDKDHIGNAISIIEKWNVNEIYASRYVKHTDLETELLTYVKENDVKYITLKEPKNIVLGDMEILIEPAMEGYDSSNNSSLITYVTIGNIRVFFGADIKKKRIEELLDAHILNSNIVKLPYHGRYISNMESLLKKLNPDFVVVTSSKIESKTENILKKLGIEYEKTKETINIEIDGISWERGV